MSGRRSSLGTLVGGAGAPLSLSVESVTRITRLVQSGPRTAPLMIVGEAPGQVEDRTGVPFSGPAGEALDRYLQTVGIARAACFVTNVAHERPPSNKIEAWLRPLHPAVRAGILQLRQDLWDIRPNLVLALGDLALQVLTRKQSITKYRGSILESTLVPGQKVMATYHPAAALRMAEYGALIAFDMPRVKEEMQTRAIVVPQRDIRIYPDGQEWVDEMVRAEWLSVDIETVRHDPRKTIICVGFADRADRALVVPLARPGADLVVRRLLLSPTKKCGQNFGQYDLPVLERHGYDVRGFAWETLYSHHALLLEAASGGDELKTAKGTNRAPSPFQRGLAFQASIYTREPYWKDDGKEAEDSEEFYRYNGKDAAVTWEIRAVHERDLRQEDVEHVFRHEMALLPLLRRMGGRGVKIDLAVRDAMRAQMRAELAALEASLVTSAGGALNVKSPKAVQALLYETLHLPVKRHRETKRPTANKDALVELAARHDHPVLRTILNIRQRRDLLERYVDARIDDDGRLRCLFDPAGTRTGRLACRANIDGTGTNLQNIPGWIRRMVVADAGKALVYADLSQAELRVVAWLARAPALIAALDAGADIHRENAIRFFGAYDAEKRVLVKRVVHGSNYGEGPERIVQVAATDGVTLNRREVAAAQEAYFAAYPEIKSNWWAEVRRALYGTRTLVTPLGWKRVFYGRLDDKLFRDALAFIPQSTVAVLAEVGMLHAAAIPNFEILLCVHDAILGQTDAVHLSSVVRAVRDAMEVPCTIHGRQLVIPTDVEIGKNWGKFASDNENGMKKCAEFV